MERIKGGWMDVSSYFECRGEWERGAFSWIMSRKFCFLELLVEISEKQRFPYEEGKEEEVALVKETMRLEKMGWNIQVNWCAK